MTSMPRGRTTGCCSPPGAGVHSAAPLDGQPCADLLLFRVGEDAAVVARSLVRLPCALRISLQPETGALQLDEAEAGVDRYYSAFETGRLPEGRFAKRIEALERRLPGLARGRPRSEKATPP